MRILKRPLIWNLVVLVVTFHPDTGSASPARAPAQLPEYVPGTEPQNHEWSNEELITIQNYSRAGKVDDRTYKYKGRVANTVTGKVDATPSFDGAGNLYFTTLKTYGTHYKTIYVSEFRNGIALDPQRPRRPDPG